MAPNPCAECGAAYGPDDSCSRRFEMLLSLDHSRAEPWGSRHGQAFAAFALQHPVTHARSLEQAWAALHRIYVAGLAPAYVFRALRAHAGAVPKEWAVPERPDRPVSLPAITIADLGDFPAKSWPERLDAWCRATLAAWGCESSEPTSSASPAGPA